MGGLKCCCSRARASRFFFQSKIQSRHSAQLKADCSRLSGEFSLNFSAEPVRLGGSEMAKKISKRTPAKKAKAVKEAPRAPLLRGWVDRFKRLFTEDLPVTDYEGTGKFDSQVEKTKLKARKERAAYKALQELGIEI